MLLAMFNEDFYLSSYSWISQPFGIHLKETKYDGTTKVSMAVFPVILI